MSLTDAGAVVIVPTFNERENIALLLESLLEIPGDVSVIVVDDNSPDGTGEIADDWAKRSARVQVIHRPGKLGLGTAYVAGFRLALVAHHSRILTMDADFSHDPRFVPALVSMSESFDVVIGSRYVPGGGTKNCTLKRKALSRVANGFAKIALGLRARDCTAGFRCYRREVLESIDISSIKSNGYSFLIEMLYLVQNGGWSIGETPILFEDRLRGKSKISQKEVYRAVQTVARLLRSRVTGQRAIGDS
jgi:glycosyltransferase involved in cell wall biosynthesis